MHKGYEHKHARKFDFGAQVLNMANPVQSLTPRSATLITKSDTTVYDSSNGGQVSGIYCGSTGDVAVVTANGETVTFTAVPIGTILPITIKQLLSTGTGAGPFVGLRY
jgi:hypothetical protein